MTFKLSAALVCAGVCAGYGCVPGPAEPIPGAKENTKSVSPAAKWTKVTLHINGFKKSKSGAI